MPELPEVENVRLQLEKQLHEPMRLQAIEFSAQDLRFKIDKQKVIKELPGRCFSNLTRHGKYLFFHLDQGVLVSHLGMTGHWRVETKAGAKSRPHDHVRMTFADQILIFNDPRRFGFLLWQPHIDLKKLNLGPDALDWSTDGEFLNKMKRKSSPIKAVLLDQKIVAGIGNIYASEILFKARVTPQRKASAIKLKEWKDIAKATKNILQASIKAGGSSIDDYLHPDGKPGGYQKRFLVYDREGEKCSRCGNKISLITQSGRSTYWCRHCQK